MSVKSRLPSSSSCDNGSGAFAEGDHDAIESNTSAESEEGFAPAARFLPSVRQHARAAAPLKLVVSDRVAARHVVRSGRSVLGPQKLASRYRSGRSTRRHGRRRPGCGAARRISISRSRLALPPFGQAIGHSALETGGAFSRHGEQAGILEIIRFHHRFLRSWPWRAIRQWSHRHRP